MTKLSYSHGLAVANGTILMALLDHLISDGVMRPHDVRTVLSAALDDLRPRQNITSVKEAIGIIESGMLPKFAKFAK